MKIFYKKNSLFYIYLLVDKSFGVATNVIKKADNFKIISFI